MQLQALFATHSNRARRRDGEWVCKQQVAVWHCARLLDISSVAEDPEAPLQSGDFALDPRDKSLLSDGKEKVGHVIEGDTGRTENQGPQRVAFPQKKPSISGVQVDAPLGVVASFSKGDPLRTFSMINNG